MEDMTMKKIEIDTFLKFRFFEQPTFLTRWNEDRLHGIRTGPGDQWLSV